MSSMIDRFSVLCALAILVGCNTLGRYETPDVNVTSFNIAPTSSGAAPQFDIGIQIINPNSRALPLRGISYSLEIEGQRVLSGAKPDLPQIPAYGTVNFVIQASPDLIGSARLISDLFSRQRDSLGFTFKARLDPGTIMPAINVEESGRFNLGAARL
ncbi:MAG: LEA type 2 family protein [Pseudohongiella sp.]|nr:LEA type 2 family protein [Pseudohongiella sp.]MDO9519439.1 LEA type 2 family protein [Pseudohongiella sp.]MDP2127553.1 LEA type 2 family protein [Pseudohongiella sp.]